MLHAVCSEADEWNACTCACGCVCVCVCRASLHCRCAAWRCAAICSLLCLDFHSHHRRRTACGVCKLALSYALTLSHTPILMHGTGTHALIAHITLTPPYHAYVALIMAGLYCLVLDAACMGVKRSYAPWICTCACAWMHACKGGSLTVTHVTRPDHLTCKRLQASNSLHKFKASYA